MSVLRYITHPDVEVGPATPVARWSLSTAGRRRAEAMLDQPWVGSISRIVSSTEAKAIETAEVLAAHLHLEVETRPGTGENDRSAKGFVPPNEFERLADAFFAQPDISVEGWERAVDAQSRIVAELDDLLVSDRKGDVAVVGHGAVGTLWYCHLTDQPISRRHDQPGQGHYYTVDLATRAVLHPWRPIDLIEEPSRVEVRPRTQHDLKPLESIAQVVHAVDGYPPYLPDLDFAGFINSPEALASWVATVDGRVVGQVSIHTRSSRPVIDLAVEQTGVAARKLVVVARLLVDTSARRAGVAQALLRAAVEGALERDLVPILDVVDRFAPAIALYERQGWKRLGTVSVELPDGSTMNEHVYLAPVRHPTSRRPGRLNR